MTDNADYGIPDEPCCDYRDHGSGECFCDEHERSALHPFGRKASPNEGGEA